jgi:mRNA interferase RelE/StbE
VKAVRYSRAALTSLRRHANMAPRIEAATTAYASGSGEHANQVKALRGSAALRLRIGDFCVIFVESPTAIDVTDIGPRGDIYD